MRSPLPLVALLVTAAGVPLACSSKKPPPPATPTSTPDAGVDAAASALPAMGSAMGSASASAPTGSASASAPMGSASAPVLPGAGAAEDAAIDVGIAAAAKTAAPKMSPEGPTGRATLAEGQHYDMIVTLQPNHCYTVVGFSPPGGVTKVSMTLLAPPLFNISAGQSAASDKNVAVIGKGKGALCPFLPLPVTYKVDAVATKGSGRVGVQLFSRPK